MRVVSALTALTAVGCALTSGSLFAFSSFVMPALKRLPDSDGLAAMQAINEAAPRSLLMLPLIGSAVGSVLVGGYALLASGHPRRGWLLAGAVLGVAAFGVTAAYHVPRNNALAALAPSAAGSAEAWQQYAVDWTRMNHVRVALALASACCLVVGLRE